MPSPGIGLAFTRINSPCGICDFPKIDIASVDSRAVCEHREPSHERSYDPLRARCMGLVHDARPRAGAGSERNNRRVFSRMANAVPVRQGERHVCEGAGLAGELARLRYRHRHVGSHGLRRCSDRDLAGGAALRGRHIRRAGSACHRCGRLLFGKRQLRRGRSAGNHGRQCQRIGRAARRGPDRNGSPLRFPETDGPFRRRYDPP